MGLSEMESRCAKHLFEKAEDVCGNCGQEFCGECLVYASRGKKPPLCIPCAVAAAGIRASAGGRPSAAKPQPKRRHKQRMSPFERFRRKRGSGRTEAETPPAVPSKARD